MIMIIPNDYSWLLDLLATLESLYDRSLQCSWKDTIHCFVWVVNQELIRIYRSPELLAHLSGKKGGGDDCHQSTPSFDDEFSMILWIVYVFVCVFVLVVSLRWLIIYDYYCHKFIYWYHHYYLIVPFIFGCQLLYYTDYCPPKWILKWYASCY